MKTLILPILLGLNHQGAAPPTPIQVTLAANTKISVALTHPISSKDAKVGQEVLFTLAEDVMTQEGQPLIKKGASVDGVITDVEKPNLTHSRGLIAFQLTSLHAGNSEVPVRVIETDKVRHDYRTRKSCGPPQATPPQVAQFYTQSQAAGSLVAQAAAVAGGSPPGKSSGSGAVTTTTVLTDPLEESSAVFLSQILDFKGSQAMLNGLANTNLWHVVDALATGKNLTMYTRKFSESSAVSLVGAGFGLWKVVQLGSGFYQHVQLAPGAVFEGVVSSDSKLTVTSPTTRGYLHRRPKIRAPKLSSAGNLVYAFSGTNKYRAVSSGTGR